MAGHTLGRWHICTEGEVANESAHSHGKHDPAVIGHEKKPTTCQ